MCRVPEIAQAASSLRGLDDDEKGVQSMHTPVGNQNLTIINESGLYSLVLTCRKPEAKRFKRWVTGEVQPAPDAVMKTANVPAGSKVLQAHLERQRSSLHWKLSEGWACLPCKAPFDRMAGAVSALEATIRGLD
jgi:prophage antirepressor-like protein